MTYLKAFSETYLSKHGTLAIKFVTYPKNYAYIADSNVQEVSCDKKQKL